METKELEQMIIEACRPACLATETPATEKIKELEKEYLNFLKEERKINH